jgi:KaiC/GvpD/RAD55 family RecA-like ATPase
MGHALKTLGELGRGLWLEWSQTSEKYDPTDAARCWESFRPSATSFEAVFAAAQRAGWVNPSSNAAQLAKQLPASASMPASPSLVELYHAGVPDQRFLFDGRILPCKNVTTLHADGGTGKTRLTLEMAFAVALGRNLFGLSIDFSGPVLFVSAEEDGESLVRILASIAEGLYLDANDVHAALEQIHMLDLTVRSPIIYGPQRGGVYDFTDLADQIRARALELGAQLVVVDNASFTYAGPAEPAHVASYLNLFRDIVRKTGGAAIVLQHEAKNSLRTNERSHAYTGIAAWSNSVRQRLEMFSPEGGIGTRTLRVAKSNYGPTDAPGEGIRLEWRSGAFVLQQTGGIVESIRLRVDARQVLMMIDKLASAGETVSAASRSPANPAALWRRRYGRLPIPQTRFWPALEECQRKKLLETVIEKTENRKKREVLVLTDAGRNLLTTAEAA